MTPRQFYNLACKVRQLQREWAEWQKRGINNLQVLQEKRQAEKEIDAEIARVNAIIAEKQAQQLKLDL